MRIRQFTAASTAEALRLLRDALGEDALVLSTRREASGVVITAAVDVGEDRGAVANPLLEHAAEETTMGLGRDDDGGDVRFDLALIRTQLDQLGRRMQRIDRALHELQVDTTGLGADAREVVQRLVACGLGAHVAGPVGRSFERAAASVPHADALRASLLEQVAIAPSDGPRVEAFVGPTGSGKTTTIAKLAARRVNAGAAPPALLVADTHRIGAADELAAYARLLGAPLHIARDPHELRAALDELRDAEQVLVDTAGLCGDPSAAVELHALLAVARDDLGVTAVVSAAASLRALQRVAPQLAQLGAERCVVTRLDEGDEPGVACTWLAETGLPLAWLGTGRRVPDDLMAASGEQLVRWLVAA